MFAVGYFVVILPALLFGRSRALLDIKRRYFETGMIPFSACVMTACLFINLFSTSPWVKVPAWFLYGYFGGILMVALSVLCQRRGMKKLGHHAVLSILLFIFAFPYLSFQWIGFWGLLGLTHAAVLASIYALMTYPVTFVRTVLYFLVISLYKLKVYHSENLPEQGGLLLLGNHVSYIDWAFIQLFCPRMVRFVIHRNYYDLWYATWFFKCFDLIPIANGASREAIEEIRLTLQRGGVVGMFPEGRLTANGQMTLFRTGFERAVEGVHAVIVPFYLHGLWGSKLTQAGDHYRHWIKTYKKEVSLVLGSPLPIDTKAYQVQQKVRELSIDAWHFSRAALDSIPDVWLMQVKRKYSVCALKNLKGRPLSHVSVLTKVLGFRRNLRRYVSSNLVPDHKIALMLPTTVNAVMMNMAILSMGLPLIHLDYSWSAEQLLQVLSTLNIDTIVTTNDLLKNYEAALKNAQTQVIMLDDLIPESSMTGRMMYSALVRCAPLWLLKRVLIGHVPSEANAVVQIFFDAQDHMKSVQWPHTTMLATIHQIASVFCLTRHDVMLNAMPFSHLSGLTVSTLMPLVEGIPMACFPDHANVLGLARLALVAQATLLLATPKIFVKMLADDDIHALMFNAMRLIVSVGDRLSAEIREQFRQKFHLVIHEGYSVAEFSPLVSCNLPDVICTQDWNVHRAYKPGSAGLPLPGYAFRVVESASYHDVPLGEVGLVLIGTISPHYNPESQCDRYHWHATSVQGFLDREGYLNLM